MTVDDAPASGPPTLVALVGPTASGKSRLAFEVALASASPPVELVSVDSMAVYRGMDIGTAKPTAAERDQVRYHLVDLVDPADGFTVQQFQAAARLALDGIARRGRGALLVGGTGLHLRAVVDDLRFPGRFPGVAASLAARLEAAGNQGQGDARQDLYDQLVRLDPVAARRMEPSNLRRLLRALEVTLGSGRPFSSFGPGLDRYPPSPVTLLGLRPDAAVLERRIAERLDEQMDAGFLEEVRGLAARPGGLSPIARQALGYRELLSHIEDGVPLADALAEAVRRTRAFARRQMAWFRRDPRIVWLSPEENPVGSIVAHLHRARAGVAAVRD